MPFCSCPHCGRTGIPFELHEAHTVLTCAKCEGRFTPAGGAVVEAPVRYEAPVRQESPQFGFQCPFCKSYGPPIVRKKISTAGWVVFVILLFACFPLCVIGLFITEDYRVCSSCAITLG
jgi:hypothetical protein